jgi:predicted dehydrogenase
MIRFGILGAGRIAHAFAKAMSATKGKLQAVASSNLDRAIAFKEEYEIVTEYDDYDQLLSDPNIDVIYIATPHAFHYDQMMSCLAHGKAILCEKSFTLNREQAESVFELAKQKNLFVMEAMWTRFLPTVHEVLDIILSGEIGEVTNLEAGFGFDIANMTRPRLQDPYMGGGALLDIGIYPITLANLILGIPTKITSKVSFLPTNVDSSETIRYYYPHAKAVLKASFEDNIGSYAWITGTKKKIFIPHFHGAEEAMIYDLDGEVERTISHYHEINGLEYEIREVIRCLENKEITSPGMPPETSIEILRQMDQLRRSWGLRFPEESPDFLVDLSK